VRLSQVCSVASVLAVIAVCASSCADVKKPHRLASAFPRDPHSTRVFEQYGQLASMTVPTARVRFAAGTRQVTVHLDCQHQGGEIQVSVTAFGGGSMLCRATGPGAGAVKLTSDPIRRDLDAAVTVIAPRGSRWSVAVDGSSSRRSH
jgi:hypothetical protein